MTTIETIDWELDNYKYRNNKNTQILTTHKGGVRMSISFHDENAPDDDHILVRVLANGEEVDEEEIEYRLGGEVSYHVNEEGETWYILSKEEFFKLKGSY